ncbi:syntaphilin isoform X2 [Ambystoma mexicanum]|uniref:syntaphilin isoform X2 n=1 Tax=Ambystoma mexicanum TaxID=8296 RepID=UPI0037E866E6
MSLPGSRRSSTGSRRRPSPTMSMRDTCCASSMSSSSNSGSCKGSDGSPTSRRPFKYTLCSENHGIKPPTPEQYLTPLQQKEVCIRHLKARLQDTQDRLQDRDTEIDDLKLQLSRMQEDWIEEECHRIEAQLALKEASKEIKQLKQVIDTVKSNLTEKDKGIQKYFVDINIQNKKLETLLHSMEIAQNGSPRDDGTGGSAGGSPARSLTRSSTYTKLSDHGGGDRNACDSQSICAEDGADSGFVGNDDALSRTDFLDQSSLLSLGVDCCLDEGSLQGSFTLGSRCPTSSTYEKLIPLCVEAGVQAGNMEERAVQTDFVHYQPDLDTILEKVRRSQAGSPGSPTSLWVSEMEDPTNICDTQLQDIKRAGDLLPNDPNFTIVVQDDASPCLQLDNVNSSDPCSAEPPPACAGNTDSVACNMEEEGNEAEQGATATASKSFWSPHFIVDLLAIVVPLVPTVAWLCRSQRRQGQPIYNISTLMRGCCTVALHSLRRISCRPVSSGSSSSSQL